MMDSRYIGTEYPTEDTYKRPEYYHRDTIEDLGEVHMGWMKHGFTPLPLVHHDEPVLGYTIPHFDFQDPKVDPKKLAIDLYNTMRYNNGIGLAANQVGLMHRVFILYGSPVRAIFNPEVVGYSLTKVKMEEGCLSFPKLFLNIERPKALKVKYQTATGREQVATFHGTTARIFLHELDHLNGIEFTSLVNRIHLDRARNKARIARRREKNRT
jgi:peptide deformylase